MINPREYRGKKAHKVHLKIRLIKHGGSEPTEDEQKIALEFVKRHGHAPRGWTFHAFNWQHPKDGRQFAGDEGDLQSFRALLDATEDDLQFGVPRRLK